MRLAPDFRMLSRAEHVIFDRTLGDPSRHIAVMIARIGRAKREDVSPEASRRGARPIRARKNCGTGWPGGWT